MKATQTIITGFLWVIEAMALAAFAIFILGAAGYIEGIIR